MIARLCDGSILMAATFLLENNDGASVRCVDPDGRNFLIRDFAR
jgi:hypothetical protein